MSNSRPAEPGELCTCGRQAAVVYLTDTYGAVGSCETDGAGMRPVLPCPWCGTSTPHTQSWGDPMRCPDYQLRPPDPGV